MKFAQGAILFLVLIIGMGCTTIGGLRSNLDNLRVDIDSVSSIIRVLEQTDVISYDEAYIAFKAIKDAEGLLTMSESALTLSDETASAQHQDAVMAILLELEKYKDREVKDKEAE